MFIYWKISTKNRFHLGQNPYRYLGVFEGKLLTVITAYRALKREVRNTVTVGNFKITSVYYRLCSFTDKTVDNNHNQIKIILYQRSLHLHKC